MKIVLGFIAVVICVYVLFTFNIFGKKSPRDSFKAFCAKTSEQKFDAAKDYCSPEVAKILVDPFIGRLKRAGAYLDSQSQNATDSQTQSLLNRDSRNEKKMEQDAVNLQTSAFAEIEVVSEKIDGSKAEITYRFKEYQGICTMQKINGKWIISEPVQKGTVLYILSNCQVEVFENSPASPNYKPGKTYLLSTEFRDQSLKDLTKK